MIKFNDLRDLLKADRTVRRFDNSKPISTDTLTELIELTRYCASGRNAQPLKYAIVNTESLCSEVYPLLKWAGYYTDWDGPEPTERPTAYLVQCLDTVYGDTCLCDDGLQLQAITLGATSLGLGGCIIKSFNAPVLSRLLKLDENLKPVYVLALGYPAERVEIVDMADIADADFKYYRTADGVHHVPKRPLKSIILPQKV